MTVNLTATQLLAGFGALVVLVWVWRAGARRARAAARVARGGARLLSLAGRVAGTSGFIVGAQWVVITHQPSTATLLAVLAVPALFAGHTITRALTVTAWDPPSRRGDRR